MKTINFSIKWKAVILLSAILLCICTFMVGLYTYTLLQQADERTAELRRQDQVAIHELLDTMRLNLEQIAVIIPHLTNVQSALQQDSGPQLMAALQQHWQSLSLNLDIHSLHLFNEAGEDNGGYDQYNAAQPHSLASATAAVARQQQPHSYLQCDTECTLFALVPYILGDGSKGVIAISQSIASLVSHFKRLTGRDLVILKPGVVQAGNRGLQRWQMSIWALSRYEALIPLIRQSQRRLAAPGNGIIETVDGQPHRVHLIDSRYNDPQRSDQPQFLSIANITQANDDLRNAIINGVASGLGGLVLAELLLLQLLWKPVKRLQQLATALPLLAAHDYAQARTTITPATHSRLRDELDLLEHTALSVSGELERMQGKVIVHAQQLERKVAEQVRARKFMAQLVDTAPLIIMTQNTEDAILTMNHWGRTLTGWTPETCGRKASGSFTALHAERSLPADYLTSLAALKQRQIELYQHEAQLCEANGTLHYIAWMHSLVEDSSGTQSVLSVGMDLTDRIEAENKLSWLAGHDTLTGLMNRHSFQVQLSSTIARGSCGALLFIDVDRFKSVNDTAGHHVGDLVLQKIARILLGHTRETDFVARLGGDEFTIILPRASQQEAQQVMAKMSAELNNYVTLSNGNQQHFSCSIGGAIYPRHGSSDEELLACADIAMYNAKQSGQGRWHMYNATEAIIQRMQSDVTWQEKIRLALADDMFRLYFQPILDIETRAICHYEVLLRMQLTADRVALPGEFIPVAERTGLIWQIDTWVLTATLKFLATHNRTRPAQPINLAVNISAPSIQSPEFVNLFLGLCAQYRVSPGMITIEITETAFLEDFESAQKILQTLVEHGCTIALDDFGVGFSPFSYLKQMPLSYVKLDGSYIRQINANPQEQTFVRCLTEMVAGFDMKTIAEFVETPEVLQTVTELGVKCAQGYLIGKPLPYIEDQQVLALQLEAALAAARRE